MKARDTGKVPLVFTSKSFHHVSASVSPRRLPSPSRLTPALLIKISAWPKVLWTLSNAAPTDYLSVISVARVRTCLDVGTKCLSLCFYRLQLELVGGDKDESFHASFYKRGGESLRPCLDTVPPNSSS